ncbi:PA2169 family four-helix-bundle protein [Adhaeretor mobilis]|uniref:DUF2383 domain-containing protein n=1 Tax=Adhaeretor mobilis TaxID=1930276 RepID=A0A517N2Q7_9BACT|nr:PA2169 family four-helix-bundle protein [Adhaeretor mobilis]QDT01426.1 hypothetical protein HG15A2_47680 [Adhaeretor mobilis]
MSIATPETVADLKPEVIENLKKIRQANIDSADGFTEAGKELSDPQLAEKFQKWAQQRRANSTELGNLIATNGEEVCREGSWLAALHRSYISLKTALSSDDKQAVLNEAEAGEDHIKGAYEEVLKETPGSAVNDVLQRQYAEVKAVHDRVRDLRDACKCS